MGPMPKKKSLTLQRVLVLLLAYIMLAVCGGVVASVLFVPGVVGASKAAKAVIPSLKVENVDFDVWWPAHRVRGVHEPWHARGLAGA